MATVRIGEKDLRVWHRKEAGSLGHDWRATLGFAALAEAKTRPGDTHEQIADLVLAYVGPHNPEIDRAWLFAHLPADCGDLLKACVAATGAKVAEPGEAPSP